MKEQKVNMHKDHIASCLCCIHFSAYDEQSGYSEFTPGSPASISCDRGVEDFDVYDIRDSLQKIHDVARKCEMFQAKD